jgi:hypothetical protein
MTPFWRGVSLRPIGASCRDDSECITKLCRYFINLGAGLEQTALGSWAGTRFKKKGERPKNKAGMDVRAEELRN